ncbi:replication-associated protein [Capybara virus 20_cap1_494]|nr:replication-associated protein [Capybara virus 20_cap1_494]
MPRGQFDFHAKNVFLTYPRCDIPAQHGLDYLTGLCGARAQFTCVSNEQHEDGGNHLHALICFKVRVMSQPVVTRQPHSLALQRKFRTRNERYFDIVGDGHELLGGEYPETRDHPNIQSVRDLNDVYAYVTKDGNFVEAGDKPACLLPPGQSRPSKRDAAFAALDAECDTVEDFMSELRVRHPYEFFTRGNAIRANLESTKRHRYDYTPDYAADSFQLPGAVQDWLDTEFAQEVSDRIGVSERDERPRALMLVGPSKTGKTQWARSLGRHMFMRENFNLDDWDEDADYIVLDDLPMAKVPGWKVLLGSMGDMVLYDRYRPKKHVRWGPKKCCIILCNPGVDWRFSPEWKAESEWCNINVEVIEIQDNLY